MKTINFDFSLIPDLESWIGSLGDSFLVQSFLQSLWLNPCLKHNSVLVPYSLIISEYKRATLFGLSQFSRQFCVDLDEGPEGVKWELGFAYFDWDLPTRIFSLGKWDLGHWDWDSETKNGNGKHVSTWLNQHILRSIMLCS